MGGTGLHDCTVFYTECINQCKDETIGWRDQHSYVKMEIGGSGSFTGIYIVSGRGN